MSKPNLYQYPGKINLFSVHEYARVNKMSIRKARREIEKLSKNKIVILFRCHK